MIILEIIITTISIYNPSETGISAYIFRRTNPIIKDSVNIC